MLALQVVTAGVVELREVNEPEPGPEETVVQLELATLNPIDEQVVAGVVGTATYPRTLGIEGLGWVGDERVLVFGRGIGLLRDGTLAERVAAPSAALHAVPRGLSSEQAAACGAVGATALRLVALANPTAEDRVLILGGSGACGAAVGSLLASRGIRFLGQTSSDINASVVSEAGGIPVVASDPDSLVAALGDESPTLVIDPLGGLWTAAAIGFLAPRGRLVLYATGTGDSANVDFRSLYRKSLTIRGYSGLSELPEVLDAAMSGALRAAATGDLRIPIAIRTRLKGAGDQLAAGAGRRGGKVIVSIQARGGS